MDELDEEMADGDDDDGVSVTTVATAAAPGPTTAPITDEQALRYIFKQKLDGEREAETTTDEHSWYTESDRNVHVLLDQRRHRRTGCIWGRMVLMRVYENQENMTMQTVLRDALQKLGLVAPAPADGTTPPARAFSVLSDISETVIDEAIEPYFREHHDLRRSKAVDAPTLWAIEDDKVVGSPLDGERLLLAGILAKQKMKVEKADKRGIKMPKAELGYTDLHNLPMLLIVTEKARMGDTFPHSLATLDLRMRTGGTLVSFVQELGRMCRYPFTYQLPFDEPSILRCAPWPSALTDEVRLHPQVRQSFRLKLPIIVFPSKGFDVDIIGHAQSVAELDALVNQLAKDQGAGTAYELHGYFDELPRAIIRTDVMKVLVEGIRVKEQQAPRSSKTTALQCVVMKGGMDDYMKPVKGTKPKDLVAQIDGDSNPWHDYSTRFLPTSHNAETQDGTTTKSIHYDADATAPHRQRLLLFAECQIGKTGAYLHFLTRLREVIRGDAPPTVVVERVDQAWGWHFPYWQNLCGGALDYKEPKEGHYFEKLATARMSQLKRLAVKGSADWVADYCAWLTSEAGEFIVSRVGREKIAALQRDLVDVGIPVTARGVARTGEECTRVLRRCVDWDSRMKNVSQLNERIDELQDANFNAANAVWNKPRPPSKAARHPKISPSTAMFARQRPPERDPAEGELTVRSFTIPPKRYGFGATLAKPAECRLHVPHFMRPMLPGVETGASTLKGAAPAGERAIRRWMFTCSWGGADRAHMRLNRAPAMAPLARSEYAQVLVVRHDADLPGYVRNWGAQYLVVAMPATMTVQYSHADAPTELHVEVGRIGYARLFSQLLADALGLDEIWMIDDNVERVWTIETDPATNVPAVDANGVVKLCECGFSSVMRGMELLLDRGSQASVGETLAHSNLPGATAESVAFDAKLEQLKHPALKPLANPTSSLIAHSQGVAQAPGVVSVLHDYAGGKQAYGVLGMQRDDPRNRLRQNKGFTTTCGGAEVRIESWVDGCPNRELDGWMPESRAGWMDARAPSRPSRRPRVPAC